MIELQNVTIRAGSHVLSDISFSVRGGQYAVIMGRTGIGKTTILEAICGLRPIQTGQIMINGENMDGCSPAARNLGYVPQDLALFPHMTVREHLEFAMRLRWIQRGIIQRRVNEMSELLGIQGLLDRRTLGLSGGEAQRVALGRALAFSPQALLLDEPMSALDSDTRNSTQQLLARINRETGVSVLHVTHNQDEARALADVCILLQDRDGQVSLDHIVMGEEETTSAD